MDSCLTCGQPVEVVEEGFLYHPHCIPTFTPIPGMQGMSFYDLELKEDIIEVVRWADANRSRSKQMQLGCSEVGHPCDRRLGYRIAGVPVTGFRNDPWPAIVGTAVHAWMEEAVNAFQQAHGLDHWVTEMEVFPNPLVKGHTDLYDAKRFLVLDWKFPSPDNLRKMRTDGVPGQYVTQVHLYGLGHEQAGRRVDRVGVVALGRQGWLKDVFVSTMEYDRQHAKDALARVYRIGNHLLNADLDRDQTWESIRAAPSRLCTWCPWHRPQMSSASREGCPGK